jgi:nucleoside-diphosphate-sugar epimerase
MRVLITGGSGFVGANLTRELAEQGHEVHLTMRSTARLWRLAYAENNTVIHEVDLRDRLQVERVVTTIRPEAIIHSAAFGGFSFQQDPFLIMESNLFGLMNLIDACEKIEFPYFLNLGSSSEYGRKSSPMKETDQPEPMSAYGVSKTASTLYCRFKAATQGLPILTLRLFSPYGPYDDASRLVMYAMLCVLRKQRPVIANPGSLRDYMYIGDTVEACVKLLECRITDEYGVLNLGTGHQTSVKEVVEIICRLGGDEVEPIWGSGSGSVVESKPWVADMSTARKILPWVSQTCLDEGLQKTYLWLQTHKHLYSEGGNRS